MTTAILVEHHSETNAGASITSLTKLVQPLALFRWAVLRLSGHATKQRGAGNDYRCRNKHRLDVHVPVHLFGYAVKM
jgi:hypothetical protein